MSKNVEILRTQARDTKPREEIQSDIGEFMTQLILKVEENIKLKN